MGVVSARAYRPISPRMRTIDQTALQAGQPVLELVDDAVDRGDHIRTRRMGANDVPVPVHGDLADLLVGDARVLLLGEADVGPLHAFEKAAHPTKLLVHYGPDGLGQLDVTGANG